MMCADGGAERPGARELAAELPPEMAVLTALEDPETLARACRVADWDLLVPLARQQRLLGQLATAIRAADLTEVVPQAHHRALEIERVRRARWFNRRVLPQLTELCQALTHAGVTPVLLKGAALVCAGIVPASGRPMADLDVLVDAGQVDTASRILRSLGYGQQAPAARLAWARQHHYQDAAWYHPDRPVSVEIHWDLMTRTSRLAFDTRSLGRIPLDLPSGVRVQRLDAPAQLTHLCLHFWRDRRAGSGPALGQLWDIHRAAHALSAQQWQDLRHAARERDHLHVFSAVLACERLLLGGRSGPDWPEVSALLLDARLRSFVLDRVVRPRPVALQLLMVTESVDYTAFRVFTRFLSQVRRSPMSLENLYGPAPGWRLRLHHVRTLTQTLLPLARTPRSTLDQMRLDRWAHRLR